MFGRDLDGARHADTRDGFVGLDASRWSAYFERLASSAASGLVAVEVLAGPAQPDTAAPRRLREIFYDAADEVIEVLAGGSGGDGLLVRHLILDPRTVAARETPRSVELAVLDASGVWTRIAVLPRIAAPPRVRVRRNVGCAVSGQARRRADCERSRSHGCAPSAGCGQLGRRHASREGGAECCG